MTAKVGDWLVIKGTTIDQPDQRGLITEVHSPDGVPPYVVRWLATDHEATVFPGADAVVVTATERTPTSARIRQRSDEAERESEFPQRREVGRLRAGRLIAPDRGFGEDTEAELVAEDVGISGGAASAEEAAIHIVDNGD
jgi:hypothetical protein